MKILLVGGSFDHNGGRASSLINKMTSEIKKDKQVELDVYNGGFVTELHEEIIASVINYNIVMWFANVSNEEAKTRDVKLINPKTILITSKRNDNNKYSFAELISRSLAIKANLTIEFSKNEDGIYNMLVFDPLATSYYNGTNIADMTRALLCRAKKLTKFTRVPTTRDESNDIVTVPDKKEFFSFAHNCADIFHNLVRPTKGTERFLGNMSFRCQNGFPSFRGENGLIYVSRRNVNKANICSANFVPVYMDTNNRVKYFGEHKPSVDTPIQLNLYNKLPWANYMLHAHCYIDVPEEMQNCLSVTTTKPIPCGALEEVDEILQCLPSDINTNPPQLLTINLKGHGCILIAQNSSVFLELQKHRDNCFVARPTPEPYIEGKARYEISN